VAWEIVQCIDVSVGYAWPRVDTLAGRLHLDERTIRRSTEQLVETLVLVVDHVHNRVHHYLIPYYSISPDILSGEKAAPAPASPDILPASPDKNVPSSPDILPANLLKTPYRSPYVAAGRDAGSEGAAQLTSELWQIAAINIHALTERQRRDEIREVQSWLDAGWHDPDMIRALATDQMRKRPPDGEPVRSLKIFRKKLDNHYRALSARRMAG
jgi:hypothetical protein